MSGIASFATTSDGEHIENPRWARTAADRLTAAQQRLQRARRGGKNRQTQTGNRRCTASQDR